MFLNRKVLFAGLMAGAAVVPYALNNKEVLATARSLWSKSNGSSQTNALPFATTAGTSPAAAPASWSPWNLLGQSAEAAQPTIPPPPPPIDYAEILRFDLPPESILQRWPRVATVTEGGLMGMRVPIVTGTREDDIAGSLTYYYDTQRKMQRIVMQGHTGDPRRLTAFVTTQQPFQRLPSLSAGMFVMVQNNQPQGILQIAYAPVVDAADPHHRASVVVELNRPGSYLSEAGRHLLQQDKQLSGW